MVRLALARFVGRARTAVDLVAEAIQLGLLQAEDLAALAGAWYERRAASLVPERQSLEHRLAESAVLPAMRELAPGPRLLDLYCGAGREAELFSAHGFDVVGVDASDRMIGIAEARARDLGLAARFVRSAVEAFGPAGRFDVVYVSPWMYGTHPGRRRRVAFLARVGTWVAPAGLLVLSIGRPGPRTRADRIRYALAGIVAALAAGRRDLEPGDRIRSDVFEHVFEPGEVETELGAAGWSVARTLPYAASGLVFLVLVRPGSKRG